MGSQKTARSGVRAAFAGVAAAAAMATGTTALAQSRQIDPFPEQPPLTAEQVTQLDTYHAEAITSMSQRTMAQCTSMLDTTNESPIGNRSMDKILQLDELAKVMPNAITQTKIMIAVSDKLGYRVCFDARLNPSPLIASIYLNEKVIALSPDPMNDANPLLSQQLALATALGHVKFFWNDPRLPEEIKDLPIGIAIDPRNKRPAFVVNSYTVDKLSRPPVQNAKKKPFPPGSIFNKLIETKLSVPAGPKAG